MTPNSPPLSKSTPSPWRPETAIFWPAHDESVLESRYQTASALAKVLGLTRSRSPLTSSCHTGDVGVAKRMEQVRDGEGVQFWRRIVAAQSTMTCWLLVVDEMKARSSDRDSSKETWFDP